MISVSLMAALALAASPYRPLPAAKPQVSTSAICAKGKVRLNTTPESSAAPSDGVANLPFAMGRRFSTLDEYLTHLRCRAAPIDLPWWQEVRPGVYQQVAHLPDAKRETATRDELMRRFGFAR